MCRSTIAAHCSYVVRIEVFAHPSTPPLDTDTNPDPGMEIISLLDELQDYSAEELQDQVYRRMEFHLCPACHKRYLSNPIGTPRSQLPGRN